MISDWIAAYIGWSVHLGSILPEQLFHMHYAIYLLAEAGLSQQLDHNARLSLWPSDVTAWSHRPLTEAVFGELQGRRQPPLSDAVSSERSTRAANAALRGSAAWPINRQGDTVTWWRQRRVAPATLSAPVRLRPPAQSWDEASSPIVIHSLAHNTDKDKICLHLWYLWSYKILQ